MGGEGDLLKSGCKIEGAGPLRVRGVARMVRREAELLLLLLLSRLTCPSS